MATLDRDAPRNLARDARPRPKARRPGYLGQLARSREVIAVLARHGLGVAASWLPGRPAARDPQSPDDRPLAVHLREALEELGTTFIKVGQILSTRADLLPPEFAAELSRLQDSGPVADCQVIRERIESELGRTIPELFAAFDPTPLAAASIGQVHAARLKDGREVVVKVQKPGVADQVEVDLAILRELAGTVIRRLPDADLLDPEGLVEEFGRSIHAELDYLREGRNADRFRAMVADDPGVRIPEVIWDHTTRRVITLERFYGIKVDDLAAIEAAGHDRRALASRTASLYFQEVFEHGFFQGDPHPGNLLILADGSIGVLDFGMVGRLDHNTQDCLLALLRGAVEGDVDGAVDAFERLGMSVRPTKRSRLRRDIGYLLESYQDRPLEEYSLSEEITLLSGILRRHRLRLPADLSLLFRSLSMAEGVGRHLDPGFVATTAVQPFMRQALLRQASPDFWGPRVARNAAASARLGVDLPIRLERLLGRVERGEVEFGWRPEGVEGVLGELNAMVNRLALAVLAAAFVVGVSVLLMTYHPEGWDVWLVRGLLVFGLGTVLFLGLSLAHDLWRAIRR